MNTFVRRQILFLVILLIFIAIAAALSYLFSHSFDESLIGVILGATVVNLADTILKERREEDG
jgi:uncharacterized integral membrane protein